MKKILLFAIIAAFAAIGQADELWWFVSDDAYSESTWNTINLYSSDGDNYGGTLVQSISRDDMNDMEGAVASIGNSSAFSSSYSFYVELLNGNERVASSYTSLSGEVGSGAVSASSLAGSISTSAMSTPSVYAYGSFSAQVVPEPTSGLLMLIGFAGLALRRRRT